MLKQEFTGNSKEIRKQRITTTVLITKGLRKRNYLHGKLAANNDPYK